MKAIKKNLNLIIIIVLTIIVMILVALLVKSNDGNLEILNGKQKNREELIAQRADEIKEERKKEEEQREADMEKENEIRSKMFETQMVEDLEISDIRLESALEGVLMTAKVKNNGKETVQEKVLNMFFLDEEENELKKVKLNINNIEAEKEIEISNEIKISNPEKIAVIMVDIAE